MNKSPIILGIETSCDETAVSIIQDNESGIPKILSNIVSSQFDIHKEFGGVVPELAARSHVEKINLIAKKALDESGVTLDKISAVAATSGPGLIICLSVGLNFAKSLASSLKVPFIGVNHLEGHALSPRLQTNINYPYLLLLISGGHSQFLSVNGLGSYKRLGTTIDDALGEAFDKTAKLLGIEFPGGPKLEKFAEKGDPNKYKLPKPIIHYKTTPAPFKNLALASKANLGLASKSILSNLFILYFSRPTNAIIAALSPHSLISGNIALKPFSLLTSISFFLIPLFAATPPATIKDFSLNEFFKNSLKAILDLTYKISSIVF